MKKMDEKIWQEIDEREPIPENIKQRMEELRAHRAEVIDDKYIKRPTQIEGIRRAGVVNTGLLDYIGTQIHDGMSTQEIDDIVAVYTKEHGGICACLNYEGFPKNVCVSINEEVCHGIPARRRKIHDGDIVNVRVSQGPRRIKLTDIVSARVQIELVKEEDDAASENKG